MAWLSASQGLKNLVLEVFITVFILSISWVFRHFTRSLRSPRRPQGFFKSRPIVNLLHSSAAGKASAGGGVHAGDKQRKIPGLPHAHTVGKTLAGGSAHSNEKLDKLTAMGKLSSWTETTEALEDEGHDDGLGKSRESIFDYGGKRAHGGKESSQSLEPNVLITAVRKGRVTELPYLLDVICERETRRHGADTPALHEQVRGHLLRLLRTCASAQRYAPALLAYDHMQDRIGGGCRSTWSLLLYVSVESGAYDRGNDFYQRLCLHGKPSGQDITNIVRCVAHAHDVVGLRRVLSEASVAGIHLDSSVRNRCLAACCTEGALSLAEIISTSKSFACPMDVVGYNSLMKSFARKGRVNRCLELQACMRENGIEPSQMTFGILLDACINARDFNAAMTICQDFSAIGQCLNKVHLTTIIKGLAGSGQLSKAESVLREMNDSMHIQPDIVTYQTLVKAYIDRGQIDQALNLFDLMEEQHIIPDALMCDSMLIGCCAKGLSAVSTTRVLDVLAKANVQPSQASLTLVVWTFAQNEALEAALTFLEELPSRFDGLRPETHLFAQLGLACIKCSNTEMARKVYQGMLLVAQRFDDDVDRYASCRLLQHCLSCEEGEAKALAFGPPEIAPLRSTKASQDKTVSSGALAQGTSLSQMSSRLPQFMSVNRLSSGCVELLTGLPVPQTEWVMDQGFIIGGPRDGTDADSDDGASASAEVVRRLNRLSLETYHHWDLYPDSNDLKKRLADFVRINNLDKRCSHTLRGLSRAQLLWVMDQEFLIQVDLSKGTANAKVISLVRRAWAVAKRQTELRVLGPVTSTGGAAVAFALDDFICINQLDDRCARLLKTLPYADVAWVMDQEFVITVDPNKGTASAKVVGLINKIKLGGFSSK